MISHASLRNQYDDAVKNWSQKTLLKAIDYLNMPPDLPNKITHHFTRNAWYQLKSITKTNDIRPSNITVNPLKITIVDKDILIRRFYWLVKIPCQVQNSRSKKRRYLTFYMVIVNAIGMTNQMRYIIQSLSVKEETQ